MEQIDFKFKLQDRFEGSFESFRKSCDTFRHWYYLGYKSVQDAWDDNPMLEYKQGELIVHKNKKGKQK